MADTSKNDTSKTDTSKKGFASMPQEKVEDIASKGGTASARKAGHEGMAERGRHGGEVSGSKRRERAGEEEQDEERSDNE